MKVEKRKGNKAPLKLQIKELIDKIRKRKK